MKSILIDSLSVFLIILKLLLIIRVIFSYFVNKVSNRYIEYIYDLTNPIIEPFKSLLEKMKLNNLMVDLSPLFAFIVIEIIQEMIQSM